MKRFLLVLFLFAATGVLTCGCGKSQTGSGPKANKLEIAVIPKGTTHEFWKSVHAGAAKAADEAGVDIIWKGPLKEDDREEQIKVVDDFVSRGVDGIVLAPLDDTALRAPVSNAANSGIPVVIFDSDLKSDDHVSFVATDNYKGGALAAAEMVRLLGGKGRVVVLRYQEGSASTANREKGFLDTIANSPGVKIVSSNQYGGATTESAYKASENLLGPLKDDGGKLSIDGIFTPNESTTFGMLRALQDAKLAGSVKFIGFDSSDKLIDGLKKGHLNGLILQNPFKMGYEAVKAIDAHLKKQKVEKRVDTGATLVTKANLDEPEIKDLVSPDLEKWLK